MRGFVFVGPLLLAQTAASLSTSPILLSKQIYHLQNDPAMEIASNHSDLYPAYNFSVPIDHFHNDSIYESHSNDKFNLRYWFDASHYKPGGPVIMLQGGETSGADRLGFLQKGIVYELSRATGGVGVIIEHRYYGESWPTANLSTESLRFLTTDQAMADCAYFAQHISFPGLEKINLTSHTTPYIAYGGSYAGGFVAFLRVLYPETFWGAIASSGVTKAIYDYWEYMEPIATYGPRACIKTIQKLTNVVDNILIGQNDASLHYQLKEVFGMATVEDDADFGMTIATPLGGWQARNWDPAVGSSSFSLYCENLTSSHLLYPEVKNLTKSVRRLLKKADHGDELDKLTVPMLNLIGYINATILHGRPENQTYASYISTNDKNRYARDDLKQTWRSWPYQYCTQWGYLQSGAGYPSDRPSLISRVVDTESQARICRHAFNITKPSDVEAINKYGGFNISYPRLAFIDGEQDPWRPATPHSLNAADREDTLDKPFILIKGAVHHWDENGLFDNETTPSLPPQPVAKAHKQEIEFVRKWMKEAKKHFKHHSLDIEHVSKSEKAQKNLVGF